MSQTANETFPVAALNQRYLTDYPREAVQILETLPDELAVKIVESQNLSVLLGFWQFFSADIAERIFRALPESLQTKLLSELDPSICIQILHRLSREQKDKYLSKVENSIAEEYQNLLAYPADSAGYMMDPRFPGIRPNMDVEQTQVKLRQIKPKALQEIFVIDDNGVPVGRVALQDIAIADTTEIIGDIMKPIATQALDVAPREEVVELFSQYKLSSIPVINANDKLVGVIRAAKIMTALQEEMSIDIQTMVGVSKDEKALSKTGFAVVKRLPWLHINLLTAFLAAAVVGLFESTIAKFTALAVLLPVVAGQSGNAGAQALAVTMRGLALREISIRHWPKVVFKEVNVGFLNGIAIAITTSICVFVWSGSVGLALVIAIAMVISMVAAGLSGAIIPITLRKIGQDPAQSSSIILTTVTDVVGFFSFLGTATILSFML